MPAPVRPRGWEGLMETAKVLVFSFALWITAKVADVLWALGLYDDEEDF